MAQRVQAQESAPFPPPPQDISSVARIASNDEPGLPLVITGTVYHSDGRTPFRDLILYFYQTDATGVYNKTDGSYRRPRLHGWVKTDERGGYKIRTIKPGSYPGRKQPAHIHVTVKLPGSSSRWLDDFLFSDDPNLTPSERSLPRTQGRFSHVLTLSREKDGMVVGQRDIIIND
ncbi:MAG: hypothetical protein HY563_10130 [Ignavibacteriales bacterium]|nr:hypothetical protein [Ignavibacteriales bacterium]